jgi:hypothetical protein
MPDFSRRLALTQIKVISSFSFILIFSSKLNGGFEKTQLNQPRGNMTFEIPKDSALEMCSSDNREVTIYG